MKTILFDLDGTLLAMDQDQFIQKYFELLANFMAKRGYDATILIQLVQKGTQKMVQNQTEASNEIIFWQVMEEYFPKETSRLSQDFMNFYQTEFQQLRVFTKENKEAGELIQHLKNEGYQLILATNPLFPKIATKQRVEWAGLHPEDFEYLTSYENSSRCKPNPEYFTEILQQNHLEIEQTMMVGNDVYEDGSCLSIGMNLFLLEDCLINKKQQDYSHLAHGHFADLKKYLETNFSNK